MKKVSVTCIYRDNTIYNLTVNHKGALIPLIAYDEANVKHPYINRTFRAMYKSILGILKENNFYCGFYDDFGARWYDIQFIDLENPYEIHEYSLAEGAHK